MYKEIRRQIMLNNTISESLNGKNKSESLKKMMLQILGQYEILQLHHR